MVSPLSVETLLRLALDQEGATSIHFHPPKLITFVRSLILTKAFLIWTPFISILMIDFKYDMCHRWNYIRRNSVCR